MQFTHEGHSIAETSGVKEKDRYNEAWATGEYLPLIGLQYTRCLYLCFFFRDYEKILDVGCGTGAAVVYHRVIGEKEAYGIDFAEPAQKVWKQCNADKWCQIADAKNIPYKDNTFDIVTCTDMLEHVPEEDTDRVLSEILRVTKKDIMLSVSLIPAKYKMPQDGSEPHICLKEPYWWVEKMGKMGYRFHMIPYFNHTLMIYAKKDENQYRRYKSLQQSLLYLPHERQIYTGRISDGLYVPKLVRKSRRAVA